MQKYIGQIFMIVVTLIGASGWFLSKNAIAELPSVGFMGIRFLLAALIFLPFSYTHICQLPKADVYRAGMVGLALSLNLLFWVLGITYSQDFGEGAFLMGLSMLIAPFMSWLIFRHSISKILWFSTPIALSGLYFLALGKSLNGSLQFSLGSVFFLLTALLAALFFVLNNQYAKNIPALALVTLQFSVVGTICSLYSLAMESWPHTISAETWLWFLASTLIASNLRYFIQTVGQKHCVVATAALIMLLEPIWTLILSVWIQHEAITPLKLTGCALILAALLVYRLPHLFKSRTG